uniref:Retrovirus-related Pol polyprotein from transposon TNT 1-94 n=1 Tax=Cajanus cajan TaxID=3821 RepID=A0A151RW70_CAJCA|nr:Retrovirus-related Pol polyprotein from transposon TNT 1-94 [Cajanus cajan]
MVTRSKNGIFKPKQVNAISRFPLPPSIEPTCPSKAIKILEWKAPMSDEFNALMANDTWTLIPPKFKFNVIGCMWIFQIKRNPYGSISRYKARLVAKGFNQKLGMNYFDTFSPVIKPQTIQIVFCLALSHDWSLSHMDINNAFFHDSLSKDIYMSQPYGFVHPQHPNYVCKLKKSLYGLKQALRVWYQSLKAFLLSYGFTNARFDTSCLYIIMIMSLPIF